MYSIIFYCRSIIFYLLTKFTLVNFVSKFSQLYFTTSQLYFTYFILYCTCFIFDLLTRFTSKFRQEIQSITFYYTSILFYYKSIIFYLLQSIIKFTFFSIHIYTIDTLLMGWLRLVGCLKM